MSAYIFIAYDRILFFDYSVKPARVYTSDYFYRSHISELMLKNYPAADISPAVSGVIVENAFNLVRTNAAASIRLEIIGFLDDALDPAVTEELSRRLSSAGYEKISIPDRKDFIKRYAESMPGGNNIVVIDLGYSNLKIFHRNSGFTPETAGEGTAGIISRARELVFPSSLPGDEYADTIKAVEAVRSDGDNGIDHSVLIGAPIRIAAYNAINRLKPDKIFLTGLFYDILLRAEFLKGKAGNIFDDNFINSHMDRIYARDESRRAEIENNAEKHEEEKARQVSRPLAEDQGVQPTPAASAGPNPEPDEKTAPADDADLDEKPRPLKLIFVELFLMTCLSLLYFSFIRYAAGPDEFSAFFRYWYILPAAGVFIFFIDCFPIVSFPVLAVLVYLMISGGRTVQYNPVAVLAAIPFTSHLLSSFMLYVKSPREEKIYHSRNVIYLSLLSISMITMTICGIVLFSFSGYMSRMVDEYLEHGRMGNTVKLLSGAIEVWNPLLGARIGAANYGIEFYAGKIIMKGADGFSDLDRCREAAGRYYSALNNADTNYDVFSEALGGPASEKMSAHILEFKNLLYARKKKLMERICEENVRAMEIQAENDPVDASMPSKADPAAGTLLQLRKDLAAEFLARPKSVELNGDAYKIINDIQSLKLKALDAIGKTTGDAVIDALIKKASDSVIISRKKAEPAEEKDRGGFPTAHAGAPQETLENKLVSSGGTIGTKDAPPVVITGTDAVVLNFTEEIMIAIRSSETDRVKKCLDSLDNVNFTDRSGWTPLAAAVKAASAGGNPAVLKLLLEKKGTDAELTNRNGWTPLAIAVAYRQTVSAGMLIKTADVNRKIIIKGGPSSEELQEWTPLMLAVSSANEEMTGFLLDNGADARITNNKGLTALDIARKNKNISKKTLSLIEKRSGENKNGVSR